MIVSGRYWYTFVLLLLMRESSGVSEIEESSRRFDKSKESLRHQQNRRPSFIARKLTEPRVDRYREESLDDRLILLQDDDSVDLSEKLRERLPEDNHEKPILQIRHGRSRNYFVRQLKIDQEDQIAKESRALRIFSNSTVIASELSFAEQTGSTTIDSGNDNEEVEEAKEVSMAENGSNIAGKLPEETSTNSLDELLSILQRSDPSDRYRDVDAEQRKVSPSFYKNDSIHVLKNMLAPDRKSRGKNSSSVFGQMVHSPTEDLDGQENEEDFRRHFENVVLQDYDDFEKSEDPPKNGSIRSRSEEPEDSFEETKRAGEKKHVQVDIVTRFLRIIENQHLLGGNCTAGTDLNLGEGVVDQYAQERFRLEANFAVNRANMLTRLWKYAPEVMLSSEYLLHASVLSMVEFDEDIFAAGNCYDKLQYKDRWLYCPFAHRLQDQEGVLVKDLAIQYKYLSNSSEWFYIARKNAEKVIANNNQYSRGFHSYTHNESTHTEREEDEILTVRYEDGRWSKPYYDCGGGNIWMLTYTVPFFGYDNDTYFFKGTSGIDIDLRKVDIDQCPLPPGSTQLNIFAASDKCKQRTTECVAIAGLGFRRGSYRCVCKRGFYFPDTKSSRRYYNGTVIEEEYEKLMMGEDSQYGIDGVFECLPCAEGCESCEDDSPCVVSLNWLMRTILLILECCVIAFLPIVALFTWKYGNVKVVRAASPVLLRVIVLGAFFIYCTTIVMYPRPNIVTCTVRVWLREIGFSLTYGALMLKTWRISVIFRVKSAKAVKITDASLLKRLGVIVMVFSVFLGIRTIVAPPVVIVARTADDLKAYLCRTDWWDHSFTTLEVMFLIWGIRLCIVVRKTPSEFNESRFISMAIYNEFLLSVFLNVSMLFLQSPANPDLLYIIFFCHTQLTVTLLLCLIFGSKFYVVFRSGGKDDAKLPGPSGKFFGKSCRPQGTSNQTNSMSLQQGNFTDESDGTTEEFRRLLNQLEILKEKHILLGNNELVCKITAMQEVGNRTEAQVSTIQAISSSMRLNDIDRPMSLDEKTIERSTAFDQNQTGSIYRKGSRSSGYTMEKDNGGKKTNEESGNPSEPSIIVEESKEKTNHKSTDQDNDSVDKGSEKPDDVKDERREDGKRKSGHARTHAIIINLDDKSRFSEEVTV